MLLLTVQWIIVSYNSTLSGMNIQLLTVILICIYEMMKLKQRFVYIRALILQVILEFIIG